MKIIIIGASGTLGRPVTRALQQDHEVITAGSKSGDLQLNITSPASIQGFFEKVKSFDALISTTGHGHFGPLNTMTDTDFRKGIDNKLMGQVNLVLIGQHFISAGGSFTLTSGIVSDDPVLLTANLSAVNGALNSFVKAAAIELKNGVRINVVSPNVVEDSPDFFPYFPGHTPVTMESVKQAYLKSVLGGQTGQTIKVH
ncbi:short chain dehydrogenase [Mucilaginibacter jinjuensis]|uniref:Short chain dehydrogenase n=1 Tax=Mucilaginibacter jinjuensis TaxID=1176721 RepID=A0ABY7TC69_9SPHI|nr:short chain dehydrogenase [Mucilaginibacter jinjuensis]WCT14105.1 short chain dehydrogenase [Mucilaginibacter jinjuensis]